MCADVAVVQRAAAGVRCCPAVTEVAAAEAAEVAARPVSHNHHTGRRAPHAMAQAKSPSLSTSYGYLSRVVQIKYSSST